MGLGATARPERLRVVGWVEDAHGRIITAAQCTAQNSPDRYALRCMKAICLRGAPTRRRPCRISHRAQVS